MDDGRTPNAAGTEPGAASVEQVGLISLVALLLLACIAAAASGRLDGGRDVGAAIARRVSCAPLLPDACHHHPLVPPYGCPLARLVGALAPEPVARSGRSGLPLVPVDFRRCRRESCAVPLPGAGGRHLTTSGRRTTAFTEVTDARLGGGPIEVDYWLYRPTLGWERVVRRADAAEVTGASDVRVLKRDDPALVPRETLPGRNHYHFPAHEEPPWLWQVPGAYPGWSS